LRDDEYVSKLRIAGFSAIDVEPWRVYEPQADGAFASAFIRAVKPATRTCCGPGCCA